MQRDREPLCARRLANGRVVVAQPAHHAEDHEGDVNSFLLGKLDSLCWSCHSELHALESVGMTYSREVDRQRASRELAARSFRLAGAPTGKGMGRFGPRPD
jgi:hypothetical protein